MYLRVTWNGVRLDQSNDQCVLRLNLRFYPLYSSSRHLKREIVQVGEGERSGVVRDRTDGKWGKRRQEKAERRGGGRALFRQPDNLPSPEHIYGCPLTPSSCSLWRRQSQWCWPACRFPIISLAEGSCLLIHQHVWTCTLSWPSISRYPTLPHNYDPRDKILYTNTRRTDHIYALTQENYLSHVRDPGRTDLNAGGHWIPNHTALSLPSGGMKSNRISPKKDHCNTTA